MKHNILKALIGFYFKQMRRSAMYWIALLFIPIVLVSQILTSVRQPFEYMMYPSVMKGVVIPIQVVMLIVSVFMYRLTSDEAQYRSQVTLPNIMWIQFQRVGAILFTHLFFSVCALILGLLPVVAYFLANQLETWSLYRQLFTHSLIFYLLPLLIAAVWGINTGLLFGKKRVGILVLFLIWVLLGPLNTELFSTFFRQGYNGPNAFFFLGPLQPEVVYYELTGFLSSPALLIKNVLILGFHLAVTLFIISRWAIRRNHRAQMTALTILLLSWVVFNASNAMKHDQLVFDRSLDMETKQHYEPSYPYDFSHIDSLLDYEIDDVQLTLEKQRQDEIEVKADYTLTSGTETIAFSLYHPFQVKRIDVNEENVSFHQVGDFIEVEDVMVGVPATLTIHYTIHNTNRFPITRDVTYLPAWLNWYPTKQAHPNSRLGSENFRPVINRTERVPVTLSYPSEQQLMTNLTEHAQGRYTGEQAGVTLLEGFFTNYKIDDTELVIDQSWTPPSSYWPVVEETLRSINAITESKFGLSRSLPDEVVLLSPSLEKFSYLDEEHLLLHVGSNLRVDHDLSEVVRAYIAAVFWSHSRTDSQVQPYRIAFDDSMAYWLAVELNLPAPLPPDPFFLKGVLTSKELIVSEKMITEFMGLSHEAQLIFLKEWYHELNGPPEI